ncbi:MAG: DUF92 domain-containing protein [Bellilinea sp.]
MNAFTPDFSWYQLAAGLGLAALISLAAYAARSLSISGAIAAALLGTAVFGLGGFAWAVLLVGFFVSSSALSRMFKRRKAGVVEKFSKGSRRDAGQVLANGGVAGLLALTQALFPSAGFLWAAAAGTLAAVNADTWATELGILSKVNPRLITNGKEVEKGTSGAISWTGTLAALGGAASIGVLAILVWPDYAGGASLGAAPIRLVMITLAGLAGSLVDSLLGATVQAIYYCPKCDKETERHPQHSCGSETRQIRGWTWLNNDGVNWICAISGALAAFILAVAFGI